MYIRTKNRIYKVESILRDNGFVKGYNVGEMAFIRKDQVINQSENLEELCDGVIEKCLSGNRFCPIEMFNKNEAIKCMNLDINKGYKEFYYGIFVEHNNKIDFISVAKMNDKGELVLI